MRLLITTVFLSLIFSSSAQLSSREVYDFEPGDVFRRTSYTIIQGNFQTYYDRYDSVYSKNWVAPDEVQYVMFYQENDQGVYSTGLDTIVYVQLDSLFEFPTPPGSLCAPEDSLYQMDDTLCDWTFMERWVEQSPCGSAFNTDWTMNYGKGLGLYVYGKQYFQGGSTISDADVTELIGFKKNGVTCGNIGNVLGLDEQYEPEDLVGFLDIRNGEWVLFSPQKFTSIKLLDMTGRLISSGTPEARLDVSQLNAGRYVVQLSSGNQVKNTSFVIQGM